MILTVCANSVRIAILSFVLMGCAGTSKDLYYWGNYEDAIYSMHLEPGKISLRDEILRFEEQIEKAKAFGKSVPPGLHAHLGYLHYNDGNFDAAVHHFQEEKLLFPESTDFVDGILERMKK